MSNPFDDDDYSAGARSSAPVKSYTTPAASGTIDDDVNFYEQEIEKYMQQSLDSTQRSRRQLEESEAVGVSTAEDLLVQREKLERTNKNLDEIDRTTAHTQRNLNSIKSVFGGLFNRFSKAPKDAPAKSADDDAKLAASRSDNKLNKTIGSINDSQGAGGMATGGPSLSETSRQAIKGTRWETMDNEIDENLDAMSSNLARLQTLGLALGNEVDDQNKLLEDIQRKADKNDSVIRHQDAQMKKILGYKVPKPGESAGLPQSGKK
uniref:t-SNARE coiled-coil homology domain-containing protein n=1 Tax=Plectus sambesii TaxID=2011161 RepID=A0A914XKN7_9BILA